MQKAALVHSMSCYGLAGCRYIFFGFWVIVMGIYIALFLPETKGVAIEDMAYIWAEHWFWRKIVLSREELQEFESGNMEGAGLPPRKVCIWVGDLGREKAECGGGGY